MYTSNNKGMTLSKSDRKLNSCDTDSDTGIRNKFNIYHTLLLVLY